MDDIKIQETDKKAEALAIAKTLPDYFTELGQHLLEEELETHALFGAFVGGQLVGFITMRQSDTAAVEISWLAILAEFHSRGIGSQLLREVLGRYAGKEFEICYVKVLAETERDEGFLRSLKFYKSLGFYTLEIIDPYLKWGEGHPCQLLATRLPLREPRG